MALEVSVLDHGMVRLVDCMGSDLSIVRAARVSYDAAWRAGQDDKSDHKLIHYLWKNGHTTPFESVTFTFEVKAPLFVFRQWHRHRTQSYNELSGRYRELEAHFYIPLSSNVGEQSTTNKQGRKESDKNRLDEIELLKEHCVSSYNLYKMLLSSNWPRELARMVLPVNIYSHMFTTMNLLNLFRFLTLRCDSHAQYEIRQYANAMLRLIESRVPIAVGAWREYGRNS